MLRSLFVLTSFIVAVSINFNPVYAQDQVIELTHQGAKGLWFPSDIARKIQADIEELEKLRPVIQGQIDLLNIREERLKLKDERILQLDTALKLSIQAEEKTKSVIEAAVRGQREAEEDLDSFWNSPGLWISVGVVGVVLLEVAAVALLNSI